MDIVVDANIIFAALVKEGSTENLLFSDYLHLFAPEYLLLEIKEHEEEILEKTKRTNEDFSKLLGIFERRIYFVPFDEFKQFMEEAKKLTTDKDDAIYLALCIAVKMPLWSNDKTFKEQNRIEVYNTTELLEEFK